MNEGLSNFGPHRLVRRNDGKSEEVVARIGDERNLHDGNIMADVDLIAAAPEMLRELEYTLEALSLEQWDKELFECRKVDIQRIIAKAKGETK